MHFKAVSIVKFPVDEVWFAMQGHLSEIAELLEEVESIQLVKKESLEAGLVQTEYHWRIKPSIPAILERFVKPAMLAWNDEAEWNEAIHSCSWKIRSHHFQDDLNCTGETLFEAALGNKGCRLTFSGSLIWNQGMLKGMLGDIATMGIEPILEQFIASNFRKIGAATELFLKQKAH
jgi:hypothetical protein